MTDRGGITQRSGRNAGHGERRDAMREAACGDEDAATTGIGSCVEEEVHRREARERRFREILILAREIAGGAAAAALAAGLLAGAIVVTGRSALWMAVGAGILVGHGVRLFGKEDRLSRGLVGAALTLACCLAGNFLASGVAASRHGSVPLADAIFRHDPGAASAMIRDALRPACLASYAFAVAIGYAVVREERLEESFLRLTARYRR